MSRVVGKSPSFKADESNLSTVKMRTLYVSNLAFDVTKVMVESAFDVEGYPLVRYQHVLSQHSLPQL